MSNENTYNVYMHAFHDPAVIRKVDISEAFQEEFNPEDLSQDEILELVFKYGQNDFQPQSDRYSVSVGDVIELKDGSLHMVAGMGFFPISRETLEKLPPRLSSKVLFPKDEADLLEKLERGLV